ncbi:hypothetical protein Zmor_008149 [Zophobas morio]|uniref:Uncharacterized protein n=1 Tax=Zophobas morio TaxID=2755281 RepID=A0AA38IZR7_9CUCU|nr:hypothetical protein Zmor_008149 [Zophobas morio]
MGTSRYSGRKLILICDFIDTAKNRRLGQTKACIWRVKLQEIKLFIPRTGCFHPIHIKSCSDLGTNSRDGLFELHRPESIHEVCFMSSGLLEGNSLERPQDGCAD